ncbi:MAG TPA: hypothetical protein PK564_02865 [bacterium]|nr:hypothetical protein [bacterium]
MKNICIIKTQEPDPIMKELGIDNVIYCEEIPLTPQQKRKVTMKRKKERKERIKRGIEYREKAFKLEDTGNFKEAIEHFKKALEYFPVDSIRYGWTIDNLRAAERFYPIDPAGQISGVLELGAVEEENRHK